MYCCKPLQFVVTGMAAQDTDTLGLLHPFCNTIAKMQNPEHGTLDTPQVNAHLKLAFTDYTQISVHI